MRLSKHITMKEERNIFTLIQVHVNVSTITLYLKNLQDLVQFEQKNQAPIDVQDANFLKQFPSLDICKMFSSLYNGSHSLICVSVCGSPCLRPNRLV